MITDAEHMVVCKERDVLLDALKLLKKYADNGTPVHPGSLDWEEAAMAIAWVESHKP